MPRTVGCEGCDKCSWINLAYMEVKEKGGKGIGDGQCNRNEKE